MRGLQVALIRCRTTAHIKQPMAKRRESAFGHGEATPPGIDKLEGYMNFKATMVSSEPLTCAMPAWELVLINKLQGVF